MTLRFVATALAALVIGATGACAGEASHAQASVSSLPSALPLRRDAPVAEPGLGWWPPLALLTCASVGGAWTLWRRRTRPAAPSAREARQKLAVRLSSAALTPQASVHVVRWNEEEFLVGCTAQQVSLIARRSAAEASGEHA